MPDHVNGCVTRAVATGTSLTLGTSPSVATGSVAQATSQALALAAQQAAQIQVTSNVAQQAAVISGITTLFAIDTAALDAATRTILEAG